MKVSSLCNRAQCSTNIIIGETGSQIKLDQVKWNVDLEEGSQVKTFHSREENQQTQPTYCTV